MAKVVILDSMTLFIVTLFKHKKISKCTAVVTRMHRNFSFIRFYYFAKSLMNPSVEDNVSAFLYAHFPKENLNNVVCQLQENMQVSSQKVNFVLSVKKPKWGIE